MNCKDLLLKRHKKNFRSHKKSSKRIKKRKKTFFFFKFCRLFRMHTIDLPSKKMTKWKAIIILICLGTAASGQNSGRIGADIAETAGNGNLRIIISHSFAPHWSSEASASFRIINRLSGHPFFSEEGHSEWEIGFRYWPEKYRKGFSISLGAVHGSERKTDMKIGAGYSIPIIRNIDIGIGYGVRIMDTIRKIKSGYNDISIEIYYRF